MNELIRMKEKMQKSTYFLAPKLNKHLGRLKFVYHSKLKDKKRNFVIFYHPKFDKYQLLNVFGYLESIWISPNDFNLETIKDYVDQKI